MLTDKWTSSQVCDYKTSIRIIIQELCVACSGKEH